MADRVLKRPMFRRGGVANEGIMSGLQDQSGYVNEPSGGLNSLVRGGYAEGDLVTETQTVDEDPGFFRSIWNAINPTSGEVLERMQKVQTAPSLVEEMMKPAPIEFRTQAEADAYIAANPDYKGKLKIRTTGEEIDLSAVEETEPGGSIINETKEVVIGDNTRTSDVKAIFEDILPLLQSTMGVDDSELNRQKYLELAKFGANLMAQPGGSLTRAIGKAAEDPLAGLTRIAETKRKGKRAPAEIAMKIALRETESGPVGKQIRDLKKVYPQKKGESTTEWNKRIGDKVTERGTDTSESVIQKNSVILGDMLEDGWAGAKAARAIDETGLNSSYFSIMPKDEKDFEKGQYYIKKDGTLHFYDGKDVLTWSPKTKKFA